MEEFIIRKLEGKAHSAHPHHREKMESPHGHPGAPNRLQETQVPHQHPHLQRQPPPHGPARSPMHHFFFLLSGTVLVETGEKTYLVKDGILNSYLHDRISAKWYGVSPTGNGRRENFRYNPIPRMRATYMESGNADPESIIASVKEGIYVDEFSNGQVKIGEGDFTFFVKSGYMIEDGRLTMPVKDINIIGNGPQALSDIVAVGNDLKVDNGTWTCGKEQSVPVSCGIPTVLISSLTVGGE